MKIAVDVRMINSSGIGVYIRNILGRIIPAHHEIDFILLGRTSELMQLGWTKSSNVSVMSFDKPIYSISEQLWWFTHGVDADVLWVPHYNIPLIWNKLLVTTVHDVAHLALDSYSGALAKKVYSKLMFACVRLKADMLLFVSEFTGREFQKYVGVPKREARVVYNGVDPSWSSVVPLEKGAVSPTVVYVGNIKPHKNLRRLLAAFELIAKKVSHKLVIVGKEKGFITGDEGVSEEAKLLGNRVGFTGFIEDSALQQLVAGADLLVLPSYYEGFGLTAIEAMACGCPVAVSQAASLPEVCGDAAAYFDPFSVPSMAETVLRVLMSEEEQNELRQKGKARAQKFSWDETAAQTLHALTSCIENH